MKSPNVSITVVDDNLPVNAVVDNNISVDPAVDNIPVDAAVDYMPGVIAVDDTVPVTVTDDNTSVNAGVKGSNNVPAWRYTFKYWADGSCVINYAEGGVDVGTCGESERAFVNIIVVMTKSLLHARHVSISFVLTTRTMHFVISGPK